MEWRGVCWAVVVWGLRGRPGRLDGDRGSWCRHREGKWRADEKRWPHRRESVWGERWGWCGNSKESAPRWSGRRDGVRVGCFLGRESVAAWGVGACGAWVRGLEGVGAVAAWTQRDVAQRATGGAEGMRLLGATGSAEAMRAQRAAGWEGPAA